MPLPPPIPKKNAPAVSGNPLPIPLKGWGGVPHGAWPIYSARFFLGEIVVSDPAHAKALYDNGYFGHGLLSSNGYDYELTSKKITRRQFERKEEWRKMSVEQNKTQHNFESSIPKRVVYVIDDDPRPGEQKHVEIAKNNRNNENRLRNTTESTKNAANKTSEKFSPGEDMDYYKDTSFRERENVATLGEEPEFCDRSFTLCSDPFPLDEPLVLMPEEALFLCYALGCLVVTDASGKQLNVDELWDALLAEDEEVAYRYVVYHQLRSEGWVVRSGARYSADYMLYTGGPPYHHAQLLVRVEAFDGCTNTSLSRRPTPNMGALNLLDRIAANVQKMYMLTAVLRPAGLGSLRSLPDCLQQLRVEHLPFHGKNLDSLENDDVEQNE